MRKIRSGTAGLLLPHKFAPPMRALASLWSTVNGADCGRDGTTVSWILARIAISHCRRIPDGQLFLGCSHCPTPPIPCSEYVHAPALPAHPVLLARSEPTDRPLPYRRASSSTRMVRDRTRVRSGAGQVPLQAGDTTVSVQPGSSTHFAAHGYVFLLQKDYPRILGMQDLRQGPGRRTPRTCLDLRRRKE